MARYPKKQNGADGPPELPDKFDDLGIFQAMSLLREGGHPLARWTNEERRAAWDKYGPELMEADDGPPWPGTFLDYGPPRKI